MKNNIFDNKPSILDHKNLTIKLGTFFKNPNTNSLIETNDDLGIKLSNNDININNNSNNKLTNKNDNSITDFKLNNFYDNNSNYKIIKSNNQVMIRNGLKNFLSLQNLVFLNKKGSSNTNPNPNLIGYQYIPSKSSQSYYNFDSNNIYKIFFKFFKSMYCLISKPVFIFTPDLVKIKLFYFVCLPKLLIKKQSNLGFKYKLVMESDFKKEKVSLNPVIDIGTDTDTQPETSYYLEKKETDKVDVSSAVLFEKKVGRKRKNFRKIGLKKIRIRKSLFKVKSFKVKERLIQLAKNNLSKVFFRRFEIISTVLSKFFNRTVELELTRLHYPYSDSNILVNFLVLLMKKKNISVVIHRLFNRLNINKNITKTFDDNQGLEIDFPQHSSAFLSGINIKISGRLMRESIIPRITTKKFEKGFTAKSKINYFDLATVTSKNRKGAFTITVKSGQTF